MGKLDKIILGMGGLAVVAFGIYKGGSNKESLKYSLGWKKIDG